VYINFPGVADEGRTLLRGAYGGNYERLVAIKRHYDPANLFRMNVNINPNS
jgi:FAD/FMN-containing dehydrogenase